jgi:hypothetical protein
MIVSFATVTAHLTLKHAALQLGFVTKAEFDRIADPR